MKSSNLLRDFKKSLFKGNSSILICVWAEPNLKSTESLQTLPHPALCATFSHLHGRRISQTPSPATAGEGWGEGVLFDCHSDTKKPSGLASGFRISLYKRTSVILIMGSRDSGGNSRRSRIHVTHRQLRCHLPSKGGTDSPSFAWRPQKHNFSK
jgi:hypothetical protein